MGRPTRSMTPERAMHRVRELRQDHAAARTAGLTLLACAVLIREAETLEREVHSMRAKLAVRDGRIARVALDNPEITQRELGERFGISWQAVAKVLQDAGVTKSNSGLDARWEKKEVT